MTTASKGEHDPDTVLGGSTTRCTSALGIQRRSSSKKPNDLNDGRDWEAQKGNQAPRGAPRRYMWPDMFSGVTMEDTAVCSQGSALSAQTETMARTRLLVIEVVCRRTWSKGMRIRQAILSPETGRRRARAGIQRHVHHPSSSVIHAREAQ
jgi:hypothetical protein